MTVLLPSKFYAVVYLNYFYTCNVSTDVPSMTYLNVFSTVADFDALSDLFGVYTIIILLFIHCVV